MKQILNLPKFLSVVLFKKISNNKSTIKYHNFIEIYIKTLTNKSNSHKLFYIFQTDEYNKKLPKESLSIGLKNLLLVHPGLEFLTATPEFQDR